MKQTKYKRANPNSSTQIADFHAVYQEKKISRDIPILQGSKAPFTSQPIPSQYIQPWEAQPGPKFQGLGGACPWPGMGLRFQPEGHMDMGFAYWCFKEGTWPES